MELHPVNDDKKAYKTYLLENVIPNIFQKWPVRRNWTVLIQQDNVSSYISPEDKDVIAAGNKERTQGKLICQPANSPDFNINDLGFFRAIQSV